MFTCTYRRKIRSFVGLSLFWSHQQIHTPELDDRHIAVSKLIEHKKKTTMDGDHAETRAKQILKGLGFNQAMMMQQSTATLSGGWRMR